MNTDRSATYYDARDAHDRLFFQAVDPFDYVLDVTDDGDDPTGAVRLTVYRPGAASSTRAVELDPDQQMALILHLAARLRAYRLGVEVPAPKAKQS